MVKINRKPAFGGQSKDLAEETTASLDARDHYATTKNRVPALPDMFIGKYIARWPSGKFVAIDDSADAYEADIPQEVAYWTTKEGAKDYIKTFAKKEGLKVYEIIRGIVFKAA